jgi:hypothetical protein
MEQGISLQQEDDGDFANRCLPKTYSFYLQSSLRNASNVEGIDKFDYFIRTEVSIFQFLNDQYYAQRRNPRFRLSNICNDPVLMDQLDESIVSYLKNRKSEMSLVKLRNRYVILLENALIRNLCVTKPK